MARVLFDPYFLQAWQHRRDLGMPVPPYFSGANATPRLSALSELLVGLGLEPTFAEGELPALSGIAEYQILVTGSRLKAYVDSEVADLVRFAELGGGLLIMSNHGAPESARNDFTRYDRRLTHELGVTLESTWFQAPRHDERGPHIPIADHPTMSGIREIAVNNCSSVICEGATSLIEIPVDWEDRLGGVDPRGRALAVAIDKGDGRVVVVSDSGFIGARGTNHPGPGMIDEADNRSWLKNLFRWRAQSEA